MSPVKKTSHHKKAQTASAGVSPEPAAASKRILLVEDEVPLAHALEMKLGHEGYAIDTASNGSDALALMRKNKYELVLLDLIMPLMDGFTVLSEMKARRLKVPVIILSNLGQDEDRTKAKEMGAVDYFVKSNTPIAEIIQRIKQVL